MQSNHKLLATLICLASPGAMAVPNATKIDLQFSGLNITAYGGPITTLAFSFAIPDSEPDRAPESTLISQFRSDVELTSNAQKFATYGFMQIESQKQFPDLGSQIVFTVPFPGEQFPGYPLNSQISGIELTLADSSGLSAPTELIADLKADFGNRATSFRYFLRLGGWAAGTGTFYEYTSDSLQTGAFTSAISRISSPIPEPKVFIMFLLGLPLMLYANRAFRDNSMGDNGTQS